MYKPAARDRVVVVGRPYVFLVMTVDEERQRADLIALTGQAYLEEKVPFAAIRPFNEDLHLEGDPIETLGHCVS